MFNPEKLLGGLIRSSTRGRRGGLGGLVSSGAALGALGVAMEVDTEKERQYMDTLASRLGLDQSTVEQIQHNLKLA